MTGTLVSHIAPTLEPVTLAEMRAHLRLDSHDENEYVGTLLQAGREYLETQTGRSFVQQTWKLLMDDFPDAEVIRPPRPPLLAVSSITYVDVDGDTQTWDSEEYEVDRYTEPGRIYLAYGESYPTARDIENAVCVTYTAGYGEPDGTAAASQAAVPESIKHALKMLVSHWYENREPVITGSSPASLPLAVQSLIWQNKVPEVE